MSTGATHTHLASAPLGHSLPQRGLKGRCEQPLPPSPSRALLRQQLLEKPEACLSLNVYFFSLQVLVQELEQHQVCVGSEVVSCCRQKFPLQVIQVSSTLLSQLFPLNTHCFENGLSFIPL